LYDYLTNEMQQLVLNEPYFASHYGYYEEASCGETLREAERVDFLGLSQIRLALRQLDRMGPAMVTLQDYLMREIILIYKCLLEDRVLVAPTTAAVLLKGTSRDYHQSEEVSSYDGIVRQAFHLFFMLVAYVTESLTFLLSMDEEKQSVDLSPLWEYLGTFYKSIFCAITGYHCVEMLEDLSFLRIWFAKGLLEEISQLNQKPIQPSQIRHTQYQLILPLYSTLKDSWLRRIGQLEEGLGHYGERMAMDVQLFMEDFIFRHFLTTLELHIYQQMQDDSTEPDYVSTAQQSGLKSCLVVVHTFMRSCVYAFMRLCFHVFFRRIL
jgi:hypothetical protein